MRKVKNSKRALLRAEKNILIAINLWYGMTVHHNVTNQEKNKRVNTKNSWRATGEKKRLNKNITRRMVN